MELDDASGLQVIITRQMRDDMLVPLLVTQSHRDRLVTGIQFLMLVPRIKLQMTRVKRTTWKVLAGEGIIKLSNIKIQYHKKKEQYTIFTIVRYCRRSPRGL